MKQNKRFLKGALCGALAMLSVMGLVSCGSVLLRGQGSSGDGVSGEVQTKVGLLEALVDRYYLGEVKEDDLEQGIYEGYISGLKDPYSTYYDEEAAKALDESTAGEYSGIGVVLSQDKASGIITAVQVYEDSPAQKAGVQENDILYMVEGEEVTGMDLSEVVTHIKGEEGTEVALTMLRGSGNDRVDVSVTRGNVEAQTVMYEMKDDGVGYVRVSEFDSVTYKQYKSALEDLENQGMKGLVVDLRSNPGGNLDTVCDMLNLMLPEGPIVSMESKSGEKEVETSDGRHPFTKPLAVLMNGYSASASEIYAAAIQDYGVGKIVGTQSYGKGVVQNVFNLKDGTYVKLTIAEYFTPKGRRINGVGVTPDVVAEYQEDESHPEADSQLERALEVVKERL